MVEPTQVYGTTESNVPTRYHHFIVAATATSKYGSILREIFNIVKSKNK